MPRITAKIKTVKSNSSGKTGQERSASSLPKLSNLSLKNFAIAAIVVAVVVLLGIFKNQFVVATVNGEPVTRLELIGQLEKSDGATVLSNLITQKLILQEAKKNKLSVTDAEIAGELKKIQQSLAAQGQNLDEVLALQNVSKNELNNQLKMQLLLKKMAGSVSVSDKEVTDFIDQNKDSIPQGTDEAQIKIQARAQVEQQKINAKIQEFVQKLQKGAKIEYLLKF